MVIIIIKIQNFLSNQTKETFNFWNNLKTKHVEQDQSLTAL